jgi:hypothetical protein
MEQESLNPPTMKVMWYRKDCFIRDAKWVQRNAVVAYYKLLCPVIRGFMEATKLQITFGIFFCGSGGKYRGILNVTPTCNLISMCQSFAGKCCICLWE